MATQGEGAWALVANIYVATIGFFTGLLAVSTSAQLFLGHLVTRYVDAFAPLPIYTRTQRVALFVFQTVVTLLVGVLVLVAPLADSSRVIIGDTAKESKWGLAARITLTAIFIFFTSLVLFDTFFFSIYSLVLLVQRRETGAAFLVLLAASGASDFLNRRRVRNGLAIARRLDVLASWSHTRQEQAYPAAHVSADDLSTPTLTPSLSPQTPSSPQTPPNPSAPPQKGATSLPQPGSVSQPATGSAQPSDRARARRRKKGALKGALNFRLCDTVGYQLERMDAESCAAPLASAIEKSVASALARVGAPPPNALGVAAMQGVLPGIATRDAGAPRHISLHSSKSSSATPVGTMASGFNGAFASSQLLPADWELYQAVLNTGREPEWNLSRPRAEIGASDVPHGVSPVRVPGARAAMSEPTSEDVPVFRMVEPRVAALDLLHSFHRVAFWSHAPGTRDRVLRWVRTRALMEWCGSIGVKPGFMIELLDGGMGHANNSAPTHSGGDDVDVTWPDVWGMFDGAERPLYFREERLEDDVDGSAKSGREWLQKWRASREGAMKEAWCGKMERRFDRFGHASDWDDVRIAWREGPAHAHMHVRPPTGREWRYWEVCAAGAGFSGALPSSMDVSGTNDGFLGDRTDDANDGARLPCLGLKTLLDDGSAAEETAGGKAANTWLALCLLDAVMCVKELKRMGGLHRPAVATIALGLRALGMIRAATKRFGRRRLELRRVQGERDDDPELSVELLYSLGDVLLYMTEDAAMWRRSACINIGKDEFLTSSDLLFEEWKGLKRKF